MAGELTITKCHLVKGDEDAVLTKPVGETGTQGQYYRLNTSSGKLEKGNGSSTTELGNVAGLLLDDVATANLTGSIVLLDSNAIVDLGEALAGLNFNVPIYVSDTDATLATSAGTSSRIVGRVVPGFSNTTPDKLLMLRST